VPQRVRRGALVDPGCLACPLELAAADVDASEGNHASPRGLADTDPKGKVNGEHGRARHSGSALATPRLPTGESEGCPPATRSRSAEVTGGRVPRFEKSNGRGACSGSLVHLYVHAVVVAAPPSVRSGGLLTEGVYAAGVPGVEDFDRYVDERGIAEEHYPAAFALWIAEGYGRAGAAVREGWAGGGGGRGCDRGRRLPKGEIRPGRRAERPGPEQRPARSGYEATARLPRWPKRA
jgi:hypothetical protein